MSLLDQGNDFLRRKTFHALIKVPWSILDLAILLLNWWLNQPRDLGIVNQFSQISFLLIPISTPHTTYVLTTLNSSSFSDGQIASHTSACSSLLPEQPHSPHPRRLPEPRQLSRASSNIIFYIPALLPSFLSVLWQHIIYFTSYNYIYESRLRAHCLTDEKVRVKGESISHSAMSDSLRPPAVALLGSSVHGILQARMLEWVVMSSSRGSSQPRDWTQVSCIAGRFFTIWATTVGHKCLENEIVSPPNSTVMQRFIRKRIVLYQKYKWFTRFCDSYSIILISAVLAAKNFQGLLLFHFYTPSRIYLFIFFMTAIS